MKKKWIVKFSGGKGQNVWECEEIVDGVTIREALAAAESLMRENMDVCDIISIKVKL